MAYGAKYVFMFSDIYQNETQQYIATIYKKDYDGAIYEVNATGSPITIETDRSGEISYRPFIASKATFNLFFRAGTLKYWNEIPVDWNNYSGTWDSDNFDFTEFITADVDTFYLEIKKKQSVGVYETFWKGWYIYTSDLTISEIEPIAISLQFSDVLLMKANKFYNFKSADTDKQLKYYPGDRVSLLDVIMRCAYSSKIIDTVNINFNYILTNTYYNPDGNTSYQLRLDTTYVQANAFLVRLGEYDNCYNIISKICYQYGLVSFFKDNQLYITSYEELMNEVGRGYSKYIINLSTSTDDNVVYSFDSLFIDEDNIIELNSDSFKNIGRDQSVSFNYPYSSTNIINNSSVNGNTPNFNMSGLGIFLPTGGTSFRNTMPGWLYSYNSKEVSFDRIFPIVSYFIIQPFHRFATSKTSPYNWSYAARIYPNNGFDNLAYIYTIPRAVKSGDYFAYDFLAYRDARLQNYASGTIRNNRRVNVKVALVLQANQYVGNDTTTVDYFYDATSNSFTTTVTYLPINETTSGDLETLSYRIKGSLNISGDGNLSVRIYRPYNAVSDPSTPEQDSLYLRYSNLQSFKGNIAENVPNSQKYSTYYNNFFNSQSEYELESNLFLLDGKKYIDYPTPVVGNPAKISPLYISSAFGNNIMDENWNPVIGDVYNTTNKYQSINYTNLKSMLTDITENIHKNIGLTNATITGTFKSNIYSLGQKFSYAVTGYTNVNYCLLDYSIDLKNSTQNSVIYSCEFSSPGSKTIASTTYIQ